MNRNLVHGQMFLFLLLSIAAALWVAAQRYRIERANRGVQLVLDYEQVAELATVQGKSVTEFLKALPLPCSVAISEGRLDSWGVAVATTDGIAFRLPAELFEQAKKVLALKARVELQPPSQKPYVAISSTEGSRFYVVGEVPAIRQLGLGLNPTTLRAVQEAGCQPVARLENFVGAKPFAIRALLQQVHLQGVRLIIFAGEEVLGFREATGTTAEAMRTFGLLYGSIEFGKQAGDSLLARRLWKQTVRVQSVSAAELTQLHPSELLERYSRAAQERNARVLYVRFPGAGEKDAEPNRFLQTLQKTLQRDGLTVTSAGARPFQPFVPPPWLTPVVGAGVGGLLGWLLATGGRHRWAHWFPLVGAVLVALLCLSLTGRKGTALLAALLFPTVGMVSVIQSPRSRSEAPSPPPSFPGLWFRVVSLLPPIFTWSLLGALHIVGLLADGFFLIKADQFVGIKVAHLLPVVTVGLAYAVYVSAEPAPWRRWLNQPIFWWQALVGFLVLLMLGVMLIRTGNEAPSAVPEWELRARALLEGFLTVRPRTKEFLIGYPALMLALGLMITGRRHWLPLWMMIGAIGQVSLVNTFCHLHTPLMVSLTRTAWSLLLGLAVGTLLLWSWYRNTIHTTAANRV